MSQCNLVKFTARVVFLFLSLFLATAWQPSALYAQTGENLQELRKRAEELSNQHKYTEALPLWEKIAAAEPNVPQTHWYLGFSLLGQAKITKDEATRKALRIRARNAFIKSKELGNKEPVLDALIQSLPPDGSENRTFSENAEANKQMNEGEALFSQGKQDEALASYQRALQLDPKLYMAALFSGDIYLQRNDFAQAEIWYQKAIAIDPNRETAYRYSATPFMKQQRYDQALDRYVEAYITEPYNTYTTAGLTRWARATSTNLAHPQIDIPTNVTFDEKGDVKINLDSNALVGGKEDGSFAWIAYGATRSSWHKEKFAKTIPNEKRYRHSLQEEADALRSVLAIATIDKQVKKLSTSLEKLKKLNDEGLLEAYILMALADAEIAADHPAYLRQNRDKLRRYVNEYVLKGGGK